MKKIALITGALVLAFSAGVYAASSVKLFVNGKQINTDVKVIAGTSYVPLRAVSEALGAKVEWNGTTRTITITNGNSSVSKPTSTPTVTSPAKTVYYKNCTEARAAGVASLRVGDPGYAKHLDRDGDGVACE